MIETLVSYLLFVGSWLYLLASIMFLYLFLKTLREKNGKGLLFLRVLTLSISLGSLTVFTIRVLSEYGSLSFLIARAIAIVNPLILVLLAFYLNYLFHQKKKK